MDPVNTCQTCKHFRLHYIKRGKSYYSINYGHCIYPRLKRREVETTACKYYVDRQTHKI